MITEIGITAGEIWKMLDEHGTLEIESVLQKVSMGRELGFMAIGWLCRESHVVMKQENDKRYLELKKIEEGLP